MLDLTDADIRAALGVDLAHLVGTRAPTCQAIARAAEVLELDGLVSPSAAHQGARTLVVFRHALFRVTVGHSEVPVFAPARPHR